MTYPDPEPRYILRVPDGRHRATPEQLYKLLGIVAGGVGRQEGRVGDDLTRIRAVLEAITDGLCIAGMIQGGRLEGLQLHLTGPRHILGGFGASAGLRVITSPDGMAHAEPTGTLPDIHCDPADFLN